MWQILKLGFKRLTTMEYTPRYSRLAGEIACFEPMLHKRIIDSKGEREQWALKSLEFLDKAKIYLHEYKIDDGWKTFHAAQQLEIAGMDKNERYAVAKVLGKEAVKFTDWRREAILSLLSGRKDEPAEAPDTDLLMKAVVLKDEYYNNQYYTNRLSRNLFGLLFVLLFLILGTIMVYFSLVTSVGSKEIDSSLNLTGYLAGVLLFGLLGALTSAILFTRNLSGSSRIKELSTSRLLVISKIFVGAGFSIFIFLLLRSSLATHIQLFSFSLSSPLDYFAIAFVSGFTERLAQRSIDLIVGMENTGKRNLSGTDGLLN